MRARDKISYSDSARVLPQNILCECFNGYMSMFSLKMLEFDDIDLFIRK